MDEGTRKTLLWLAKRLDEVDKAAGGGDPFLVHSPCARCGHGRHAHVEVDDATMEAPAWPCAYPRILGAPIDLCNCEDFQPQDDDS